MRLAPLTKIRLGLVGFMALVVGVVALRSYVSGKGWVHVMFPPHESGKLLVDGRELAPNDAQTRTRRHVVPQGKHRVSIERANAPTQSYDLTIDSGFDFKLIPLNDQ